MTTNATAEETKRRRVLVIDDNASIHDDFAKVLAPKGGGQSELDALEAELFDVAPPPVTTAAATFEVAFAGQGEDGVRMHAEALAAGAPFAVAFVDMRMPPGISGIETIRRLWAIDPELQCVICTAYSDYSWEEILAELGMNDRLLLLRKPFDAAEVCQLACALTEKWHLAKRAHLKLEQLRAMVEEQTAHLTEANVALAESEARYALAAEGANDGLWDYSLECGAMYYSPRWRGLLGISADVHLTPTFATWLELTHPADRDALAGAFAAVERGDTDQISLEYRIRHADGQYRWMHCRGAAARPAHGRARAAGSQTDITNRKVAEAQLRHDAHHDALTGLPNRALLTNRLEHCLARQRREPSFRFAVMFMDLDRFKVINDSLGHLVGDALLVALASRLTTCVRGTDTVATTGSRDVARLGGDEFVVLLEGIAHDADALRVAERLLASVATPFEVLGHTVHATLSIGIALGHAGYQKSDDILRDADIALYRAKSDGRNRYGLFSDDLHVAAMLRWQTENDLRDAIAADQLVLHYQPVMTIATGEIAHFEALVRWQHPTRGLLYPGEFIPLAEETGLIVDLGRRVVSMACAEWREWANRGHALPIAVNVASKQFAHPRFVEDVARALAEHEVPSTALRIELTESATMDVGAIDTCAKLAELGVYIYLDDFGTGYSSLSYLTRMPIRALKIDRSFVSRMLADPMSASIVQTIQALATALGMETVAEGVESEAEADALRRLGCQTAQGYLWAKPLPADRARELARNQRQRATRVSHVPSGRSSIRPQAAAQSR